MVKETAKIKALKKNYISIITGFTADVTVQAGYPPCCQQ